MFSIIIRTIIVTAVFELGCYCGKKSSDKYTSFEKRREIKKICQAIGTVLVVAAALIP